MPSARRAGPPASGLPTPGTIADRLQTGEGAAILSSVGCYHFEGRGAQLFDKVEGDYFAVLGLPLLPVLAQLRKEGILPS